jgi:cysteine-rich repeat protein
MVVTKSLRENDVGVMATGHQVVFSMFVPPGRDHYTINGWCPGACTEEGMSGDIVVFGAALHGHTAAARLSARHFRNGAELKPLATDNTYDFNLQAMTPVIPHANVSRGDTLLVQCTYDSSRRDYTTKGGLSTAEEMCLTYLWYYPKANGLDYCQSNFENGVLTARTEGPLLGRASCATNNLPNTWQAYEDPSSVCSPERFCGDGVIDVDLGEQCDDGNRLVGDECDGECFPGNDVVCFSKSQVPFASKEHECRAREKAPAPENGAASQCDLTIIGNFLTELTPNLAKVLSGEDFVLSNCVSGLKTCNPVHENHDPACINYVATAFRTLLCCQEGGVEIPIPSYIVDRIPGYIGTYCGGHLPLDPGCDYCGDGSLNSRASGEECDDGNNEDGDGCSANCTVEQGKTCITISAYSICGAENAGSGNKSVDGSDLNWAPRSLPLLWIWVLTVGLALLVL